MSGRREGCEAVEAVGCGRSSRRAILAERCSRRPGGYRGAVRTGVARLLPPFACHRSGTPRGSRGERLLGRIGSLCRGHDGPDAAKPLNRGPLAKSNLSRNRSPRRTLDPPVRSRCEGTYAGPGTPAPEGEHQPSAVRQAAGSGPRGPRCCQALQPSRYTCNAGRDNDPPGAGSRRPGAGAARGPRGWLY